MKVVIRPNGCTVKGLKFDFGQLMYEDCSKEDCLGTIEEFKYINSQEDRWEAWTVVLLQRRIEDSSNDDTDRTEKGEDGSEGAEDE
jgi:hypothetical protein